LSPRRQRRARGESPKPRPLRPPVPRRGNRLTLEGALFIGLTLLIGMAAVNSGHNLLYLVFSVMLALLLVSGALARLNLRGLSVQRRYPLEFHCDQPVPVHLEIHNAKRLFASFALRVQDFLIPENPGREGEEPIRVTAFAPMVRPGRTARRTMYLRLPRRGLYRMVSLRVISRHPFGFFQRALRLDVGGQLLVFPRLVPTHLLAPYVQSALGEREADRKGVGMGLFGIRNYQPGDPARLIHWKQSAKGQGLKLKEFEEERSLAFRLILDLRCADPQATAQGDDFEKAVSLTASLARHLLQHDCSVALWTSYGRVAMGAGRLQLQRILRALACVTPQSWEAEIPFMENEPLEVVSLWVAFQDLEARPAGVDRGFRRPPGTRLIDVRRLNLAEPNPTTGNDRHGH
jgi:uncharacterized protein (DUF58 family)